MKMSKKSNNTDKVFLIKMEEPENTEIHPPFGLLYVADALRKENFNPKIIHKKGTKKNINLILRDLQKNKPLFVGFSTYTAMGLIETIELSKKIKQNFPEITIVWGGVHSTLIPEKCLKEDYVDVVVKGEGEITTVELAKKISKKKSFKDVKGIGYKEYNKIKFNEERDFIKNLDYFSPAWDLVDVKYYLNKGQKNVFPLITSRGCPFRCSFCYNLAFNRRLWRTHSVKFVLNQIKYLNKACDYKIKGISFFDDNFFVNKKRGIEIVKKIGIPWFAEIRADMINRKFLKEIKNNNCRMLFIGAESGSDRILKLIKKDITTEDVLETVKNCKDFDIDISLSFMVGFPSETTKEVYKTLDFIMRIHKIHPKSDLELKIYTPYPGTSLYELGKRYGFYPPKKQEHWSSFKTKRCNLPWIKNKKRLENIVEITNLVTTIGRQRKGILKLLSLVSFFENFRIKKRVFSFTIEIYMMTKLKDLIKKSFRPSRF